MEKLIVMIPKELKDRAQEMCEKQYSNFSIFTRQALKRYVEELTKDGS